MFHEVAHPDAVVEIRAADGASADERVVFASAPDRPGTREELAARLARRLSNAPDGGDAGGALRPAVSHDVAGRPRTSVDGRPGPFVSFSHADGRLWAAASAHVPVGIDVAHEHEFAGDYPFDRVFGTRETADASSRCGGGRLSAAAMLWAAKEAAVKAFGTGFNPWDPLHTVVELEAGGAAAERNRFRVQLGDRMACGRLVPRPGGWIAVAWIR
jgi:phosphopantetheinyl transferase (holo-ACP synthase)